MLLEARDEAVEVGPRRREVDRLVEVGSKESVEVAIGAEEDGIGLLPEDEVEKISRISKISRAVPG